MRTDWSHLDKFRTQQPPYTSPPGSTFGSFAIKENGVFLNCIAVDGTDTGWEHVSVHVLDPVFKKQRTPRWDEMCAVKALFWEPDEVVVQLHVAQKDWVCIHDHVLHLWRSTKTEFPLPDKAFV